MLNDMESSRKNLPPMSAGVDRIDIIAMAIDQLALAQVCVAEMDNQEEDAVLEALEDKAKAAIQQASSYMSLAHRGKRLLIVEVGLPDLEGEEC